MKKIISLFKRDYEGNRQICNEIVEGAEWVSAGEGVATQKFDGTCAMVEGSILYKRYDVKKGREVPQGFIAAQDPDPVTGHWPGWVEVGDGPEDKWFVEARDIMTYLDGTYELCGPKVQKNPEGFAHHELVRHGAIKEPLGEVPTDFEGLREYFRRRDIEGIVWHHPDGRMVKIKAKDFGIKRGANE